MKIFVVIFILCILICLYFFRYTPYPFVYLLRYKKEKKHEKATPEINALKDQIQTRKGLPYPSKYSKATYDVYTPKEEIKHILIWIHGGSFISGNSEGVRNFGPLLANEGTMVYAINYAYAPENSFPSQILQLDEFLKHLQMDLLPNLKANKTGVFLGGDSAGANIVASYATMLKNPELSLKAHVSLRNSLTIVGLLLFCGPYDFCEDRNKEEWKQFKKFFHYIGWSYLGKKNWDDRSEKIWASPLQNINASFPPSYICDGKKFSFLWQGKKLVQELKQLNIYVTSRFYDDMPHEFQFDYVTYHEEATQVFEDCKAFLETIEHT